MGQTDKGLSEKRKELINSYLTTRQAKPDIIFFQELPWKPTELGKHVAVLTTDSDMQNYDYKYFSKETHDLYNCVTFNKRKFKFVKNLSDDLHKHFDSLKCKYMDKIIPIQSQLKTRSSNPVERQDAGWIKMVEDMKQRMCAIVLREKASKHDFIAVSLHNFSQKKHNCTLTPFQFAELFCEMLARLGDACDLPIILAGDFNADIWRSKEIKETLNFIVYDYYPNKRRQNEKVIDFFLFRGSSQQDNHISLPKDHVEAENPPNPGGEAWSEPEKNLICNHDPLKAVLNISGSPYKSDADVKEEPED